MTPLNRATSAYLDDYLATPSEFAVLISAPWGAGKTYFINEYFAHKSEDTAGLYNHLIVSLFGVDSPTSLDRAIALARFGGADGEIAEKAGHAFTGALKHFTGVDLTVRLEDIARTNLPDVLIFDDLERTSLKPHEVLGAINGLVEKDAKHVILLCNEEKFFGGKKSLEIKEKTIGATLSIEPDVTAAIPYLLSKVSGEACAFLDENTQLITEIFDTAGHANLRSLGQALWDFDRIYREITPEQRKKTAGLVALLRDHLILAIEYKAGVLDSDALKARAGLFMSDKGKPEESKMRSVCVKHGHDDLKYGRFGADLPTDLAYDVIVRGAVTSGSVQDQLRSIPAFQVPETEPPWRKLWWARWRSRSDVEAAYQTVISQLARQEFANPFIVLHVFSTLIELSKTGIEMRSAEDLEGAALGYFGAMPDDALLFANDNMGLETSGWDMPPESYDGLGFPHGDDDKTVAFRRMWHGFVRLRDKAIERQLVADAQDITTALVNDPDELMLDLVSNNRRTPRWGRAPVLARIDCDQFADGIMTMTPGQRRTLGSILKDRLQRCLPELLTELEWLIRLKRSLDARYTDADQFTRWQLDPFMSSIDRLLANEASE